VQLQAAYDAQRRRGVGHGQMINTVNDMLDYENGPSVDGVRYSNVSVSVDSGAARGRR